MTFDIVRMRKNRELGVVLFGNHPGIIQSMLDFDFMAGKPNHSVLGIVGVTQKNFRYFWGKKEIIIPGFLTATDMPEDMRQRVNLFVVLQSARRVLNVVTKVAADFPSMLGGVIFAEGAPEQHALKIRRIAEESGLFVLGPSSVGLVISGKIKLGAIGGVTPEGIEMAGITEKGSIAVISSSGGMVNELINMVAKNGFRVSFAAALGGERYPATTPLSAIKAALRDTQTEGILYFGELGGQDEYDIADYMQHAKEAKPVLCYVAGTVAEYFDTPPQFGHAKAMAGNKLETASAKKEALRESGVFVADSFLDLERKLRRIFTHKKLPPTLSAQATALADRRAALFIDRISADNGEEVTILGEPLLAAVDSNSFSSLVLSMLLGFRPRSAELGELFDFCLRLLVDHGPQVSGAVNTMITARAGKDLASALASGMLTIGPRFGGAINEAAHNWFSAVESGETAGEFVERFARSGRYVAGIGHKKYSLDNPDPRVQALIKKFSIKGPYLRFAKNVEAITTAKKAQLILNVDGVIAALMLDLLVKKEGLETRDIRTMVDCEFFNAVFILSRSVGFAAHFMEQKRLDEGLFRLPDNLMGSV